MTDSADSAATGCHDDWSALHWEGAYEDYMGILEADPRVARNAFQRLHDMLQSHGTAAREVGGRTVTTYGLFDDPLGSGADAVYGLEEPLGRLADLIRAAAIGLGPQRRVWLLHGPVGSSKSTIARLLKRGLEDYSHRPEGALYSFSWLGEDGEITPCPMNEDPLMLLSEARRNTLLDSLQVTGPAPYRLQVAGELCPLCRWMRSHSLKASGGDEARMLESVRVRRVVLSEKDRIGIGTFQPKDEKNQDSTELTGDLNFRKLAEFGADSDPRAFNFDGEFNIANRGLLEFVEVLKLDVAFLYDLLGASQEHTIKPRKFPQTDIDEVILGHTNEPEFKRLQGNEMMEAFRDRTLKIDVPYNLRVTEEARIYRRAFRDARAAGRHLAPHAVDVASLWVVLTRLEDPQHGGLTRLQKLRLYDGDSVSGFTQEAAMELREEAPREGMDGISPRYVQDRLAMAFVSGRDAGCVGVQDVLDQLAEGLDHHSLLASEEDNKSYRELLSTAREEYEDLLLADIRRALASDTDDLTGLCANYLEHARASTLGDQVKDPVTGDAARHDESFLRSVETKIEIPESRKNDFRQEIMNYIGALALEGRTFDFRSNDRLHRALELKLFEDRRDSLQLTSLTSGVVDPEAESRLEDVRGRLVRRFGYCEVCARTGLEHAASLLARPESVDEDPVEED